MKGERWRQVDEIFGAALEREPSACAAFLDAACAGDAELRREVEEMLRFDQQPTDFIEGAVREAAAGLGVAEATPTEGLPAAGRAPARRGRRPAAESSSARASDSIDDARFVAGDKLAGRYRIVGLLGRGGMGEVYRAEDLKLKQPVALKFLPERLSGDAEALARFFREVSVARQVSHRHVCRVYDTGEAEGLHFISMEYVRGEELSSLLKRIGRLPHDKAVEIARQLCAGLGAVHEAGVLHRDLKPANVMIDERGDVRITDFGIAALAADADARRHAAGTPLYMSPEQLEAKDLTPRSDIYSLGLVLYELFTGKRAFEADSLQDLLALRRSSTAPTNPSRHVADLDPLVERIILRCLERDPARRPATALQVAAALPGGDPLAAALAAGETPSPEMVAAAPKAGSLRPAVAVALLAWFFVGVALTIALSGRAALHSFVPLERSADDLKRHAAEVARRLGHDGPVADTAHGFDLDLALFFYVREHDPAPDRWEKLKTGSPPLITFWYRQSARYLEAYDYWVITPHDPPPVVGGMATVMLDTSGRLTYFEAVPPQLDGGPTGAPPAEPDWPKLFAEAGLEQSAFRPAPSQWNPPQVYDARAAWEGTYPGRADLPLRVEAASYRGRFVYFETVGPWHAPTREAATAEMFETWRETVVLLTLFFGALALGVLLAWRNLRLGRGDRRGAFRLALFFFVCRIAYWVFNAHHVPTLGEIGGGLVACLQSALFWGCFFGIMYLALEPFLRRRWPEWLISWSRLLAGRFRDPLVGRDLLVGAAAAAAFALSRYLDTLAPTMLGQPLDTPHHGSPLIYNAGLLGLNSFVPLLVNQIQGSLMFPFVTAALVLFFLMVLRRKWAALFAAGLVIFALQVLSATDKSLPGLPFIAFATALIIVVLARFGLLATVATFFFLHFVVFYPVTTRLSAGYAGGLVVQLAMIAALALYAFRTSLAGQPLLGGKFLDD
jgi:predicted Ser/Thr protein kinase